MTKAQVAAAAMLAGLLLHSSRSAAAPADALQRYVEDYRSDPMLVDAYFGVRIGESWWTIESVRGANGAPPRVTLVPGQPARPTWVLVFSEEAVLERLDRGEVAFGTLAGKTKLSDTAPVDVDFMPGYAPDGRGPGADFYETFTKIAFHFWYRGTPEVVPFKSQALRTLHGADATALYYEPGLRMIWFSVRPGQHANEGKDEGVGPWRKVYVFTGGAGTAKIGEETLDVRAGERVFVPPGARNEVWNDGAEPLEGVLIIFGEGA